jgi:hypothetical protein
LDGDVPKGKLVYIKEMKNSYVDEFFIQGRLDASMAHI